MKKIIRNPRKGITLMELVIALSVIMIITIASISMLQTTIKIEVRAAAIIEANNSVETIVECFNYAYDNNEFKGLVAKLHGSHTYNNDGGIHIIDRGSYKISIEYTDETEYSKIEISAIYGEDFVIYENITYYKYKGL